MGQNPFQMMKQAYELKKQMTKIQKELEKQTSEGSSGDVHVVVRGDMTVKQVTIDPVAIDLARKDRLEKMIAAAVNNAMETAKKQAGQAMQGMTGGLGGLGEMLGMR